MSVNPGMSPAEVINRLRSSADDVGVAGWDPSFGAGRVNAARAVAGSVAPPDSTPPSILIVAPSDGSTVSGTVSIQNSASDNVGVASVSCYLDGAMLGSLTAAPFNCSWNTTATANGGHALSSVARDAAGNSSSASRTVNVSNLAPPSDTTVPVISILSPAAGSTVSGSVSVSVQASDNVRVVKVQLYVDGVLTDTVTAAPWATKWNTNGKVAKGAHTLQVRAYDAANNVGISSTRTVYK
jgi:hypothetical protein